MCLYLTHVREQLAHAHASVCGVQIANKLKAGGTLKGSRGQGPPTQTQPSGGKVKRNTFSSVSDFVASALCPCECVCVRVSPCECAMAAGRKTCADCEIAPTWQFVAEFVVVLMQ